MPQINQTKQILYLDLRNSGIAGDMMLSLLYPLLEDKSQFDELIKKIQSHFTQVKIKKAEINKTKRNGLYPFKLDINFSEHKHHGLHVHKIEEKITLILKELDLTSQSIDFAISVFKLIYEAEAEVHNSTIEKVHLHEVGSIDTVIDVCGVTLFLDKIGFFTKQLEGKMMILSSPIAVGGGNIKISHGIVPVPAPATAKILGKYNIPVIGGPIEKELCTPTGAAIIGALVKKCNMKFNDFIPEMELKDTFYSCGTLITKNFPNIASLYTGKSISEEKSDNSHLNSKSHENTYVNSKDEDVAVLETTVDDVTGEVIGHMMDLLLQNGALDVNFISVQSKKNRPGIMIRVISPPKLIEFLTSIIIKNTGTLGVRYRLEKRKCLNRSIKEFQAEIDGQTIKYNVKIATPMDDHNKIINFKIEYEDLAQISKILGKNIKEIKHLLEANFRTQFNLI